MGNTEVVRLLLKNGANGNTAGREFGRPLQAAVGFIPVPERHWLRRYGIILLWATEFQTDPADHNLAWEELRHTRFRSRVVRSRPAHKERWSDLPSLFPSHHLPALSPRFSLSLRRLKLVLGQDSRPSKYRKLGPLPLQVNPTAPDVQNYDPFLLKMSKTQDFKSSRAFRGLVNYGTGESTAIARPGRATPLWNQNITQVVQDPCRELSCLLLWSLAFSRHERWPSSLSSAAHSFALGHGLSILGSLHVLSTFINNRTTPQLLDWPICCIRLQEVFNNGLSFPDTLRKFTRNITLMVYFAASNTIIPYPNVRPHSVTSTPTPSAPCVGTRTQAVHCEVAATDLISRSPQNSQTSLH
ncbi:hypothetical protein B0H14DRAFT_2559151 [Mycena olivaceomarginata]|nr:hypothetical protein B0H14DRAFT_2559151 [Mycena olivaceomarginata]